MTTNLTQTVQDALEKLAAGGGQIVLDFSPVTRIDPSAIRALQALAAAAHDKAAKVVLGGVNVDVYRVLKLMKLTSDFVFPACL